MALGMTQVRSFVLSLFHASHLIWGGAIYLLTGKTPARAYQALIYFFCKTQGKSNVVLTQLISYFRPWTPPQQDISSNIGRLSSAQLNQITQQLDSEGYCILDFTLNEKWIEELYQFSLQAPCVIRGQSNEVYFEPGSPKGIRYDYSPKTLVQSDAVLRLARDPILNAIAGSYLRAQPILDTVEMWWNTDYSTSPDVEAAQFFHFDMDRIKWLKFFFYLTDVDANSGPHSFVSQTQREGGIPRELLSLGYTRLTDEQVLQYFSRERLIEFVGKKGTIIAEDTRGLHKGKHVKKGQRLVFQVQFTNSNFGANTLRLRDLHV